MKKTIVYVDALNLYYGLLKGTSYKWLDIYGLVKSLLPKDLDIEIVELKYFCARVSSSVQNPQIHIRQGNYLLALEYYTQNLCSYRCIEGYFKNKVRKTGMDVNSGKLTTIETNEEKGTDVNLGVHIVHDSHSRDDIEAICLISNDTDLYEALKISKDLNKEIYLIAPIRKYTKTQMALMKKNKQNFPKPAGKLTKYADWFQEWPITSTKLAQNQLPNPCDIISKPSTW